MEIIFYKTGTSFTGSIRRSSGYFVQKRGKRFFGVRNSNGIVPPEGHLRFIFDCAAMAKDKLIITDIQLKGQELIDAYNEAGYEPSSIVADVSYNAHDVFSIKKYEGFEV